MFASRYQGGASVTVADVVGSRPLAAWGLSHAGAARRTYERAVKGYMHVIGGGPHTSIQLPQRSHQKLSLEQPFFLIQIRLPAPPILCSFELIIIDTLDTRRRLQFSTSVSTPVVKPAMARLPLSEATISRLVWVNLCVDLASLSSACFKHEFRTLESIVVRPHCSIRKIFTLKCPPSDLTCCSSSLEATLSSYSMFSAIPATLDFSPGVDHVTHMLNWEAIISQSQRPTTNGTVGRPAAISCPSPSIIPRRTRLSRPRRAERSSLRERSPSGPTKVDLTEIEQSGTDPFPEMKVPPADGKSVPSPTSSLIDDDDDGELSEGLGEPDPVADGSNGDEEEFEFVQSALKRCTLHEGDSTTLSSSSWGDDENRDVVASDQSTIDGLPQSLRPGRVSSPSSSRCTSTSTSSVSCGVLAALPQRPSTPVDSDDAGLMFDPILNRYFDPSANTYLDRR